MRQNISARDEIQSEVILFVEGNEDLLRSSRSSEEKQSERRGREVTQYIQADSLVQTRFRPSAPHTGRRQQQDTLHIH